MDGVDHAVQVTASTQYEAVALGLASLRCEDWVAGVAERLNAVRVCVAHIPIVTEAAPTGKVAKANYEHIRLPCETSK